MCFGCGRGYGDNELFCEVSKVLNLVFSRCENHGLNIDPTQIELNDPFFTRCSFPQF